MSSQCTEIFLKTDIARDLIDQILDRINTYKKCVHHLTEKGIEGYIVETEQPGHLTVSVKDLDNKDFRLEQTECPDVLCEELMYGVLEGTFLDDNFEILNLHPMRWQDWYKERIDCISKTLKTLSEYIEHNNRRM